MQKTITVFTAPQTAGTAKPKDDFTDSYPQFGHALVDGCGVAALSEGRRFRRRQVDQCKVEKRD